MILVFLEEGKIILIILGYDCRDVEWLDLH